MRDFRLAPRRLTTRILLTTALIIACFTVLVSAVAWHLHGELEAQLATETEHVVDVAHALLVQYDRRVAAGTLDPATARERALASLGELRYGDDHYFYVLDARPSLLMHPERPDLVGEPLADFESPDGERIFQRMVELGQRAGGATLRYQWPDPDGDGVEDKLAHVRSFAPWGWIIGSGFDTTAVRAELTTLFGWIAAISVLVLAGSAALAWHLSRSITRPIAASADLARHLAEGDLTRHLDLDAGDEVGKLAASLNAVTDNLQLVIGDVADGVHSLASSSDELLGIAAQMSEGSESTSSKTTTVAAATEEMSTSMTAVAEAMNQAAQSIDNVAAATEEMTATIGEIASHSDRARTITGDAVSEASRASERVNELGDAARDIGKIIDAISDISAQTNLLALNATIEAARAGEAGRGFTVVAGEIKDLARQTDAAAEEIKERIAGIQSATSTGVAEIEGITQTVRDVNELVAGIAAAIEEQSATTRTMASDVSVAARGLQDVNQNVTQSSEVAVSIARDISGVSTATEGISSSSGQVRQSAESLAQFAASLREKVAGFKVTT
jgi:methyl-accepting chemotaxis protein